MFCIFGAFIILIIDHKTTAAVLLGTLSPPALMAFTQRAQR
jgi:hypothetical protein